MHLNIMQQCMILVSKSSYKVFLFIWLLQNNAMLLVEIMLENQFSSSYVSQNVTSCGTHIVRKQSWIISTSKIISLITLEKLEIALSWAQVSFLHFLRLQLEVSKNHKLISCLAFRAQEISAFYCENCRSYKMRA